MRFKVNAEGYLATYNIPYSDTPRARSRRTLMVDSGRAAARPENPDFLDPTENCRPPDFEKTIVLAFF